MLELDGSLGEGGGQIVRSALALSMCTGTPFRIERIRAKRAKPGLMRQHLTAVLAAAEICDAKVEGAAAGSATLQFIPGKTKAGDYRFAVGSAGSCTLVLQTILPALLRADAPSRIVLQGGTHNPMAPPFHFLEQAFLPLLRKMGAEVTLTLDRYGFYPAGGGQFSVMIQPHREHTALHLRERGNNVSASAFGMVAGIPVDVAKRELAAVAKAFNWTEDRLKVLGLPANQGPGNALMIVLEHDHLTEVFMGFGVKGIAAETVAKELIKAVKEYRVSSAAVGPYLADQLLLPMALLGEGSFTATRLTQHCVTNAHIIEKFLAVSIETRASEAGQLVEVRRKN
jgi:RNA 3'-terminal phosphate cyclase (ATP)